MLVNRPLPQRKEWGYWRKKRGNMQERLNYLMQQQGLSFHTSIQTFVGINVYIFFMWTTYQSFQSSVSRGCASLRADCKYTCLCRCCEGMAGAAVTRRSNSERETLRQGGGERRGNRFPTFWIMFQFLLQCHIKANPRMMRRLCRVKGLQRCKWKYCNKKH